MTNPQEPTDQEPTNEDPSVWARPANPNLAANPATPAESSTTYQDPSVWARPANPNLAANPVAPAESSATWAPNPHVQPQPNHQPTIQDEPPAQPNHQPTIQDEPPAQPNHQPAIQDEPPAQPNHQPAVQDYQDYSAEPPHGQPPWEVMDAPAKTKRRFHYDPLSIILILVIMVALLAAGLAGAEIYARKRAEKIIGAAFECEMQDKAKVSIGIGPRPFMLQYVTGNYTGISIHTAGNHLLTHKGMKADITLNGVELQVKNNSKGTIGAVDADIIWTSSGIKATLEEGMKPYLKKIPYLKKGIIESITTNPDAGTIKLSAAWGLAHLTLKPQLVNGELALEPMKLTAVGTPLPRELAELGLKTVNSKLMKSYPLDMRADRVQVTKTGVKVHFSKRNASIPSNDPCFAHI